MEVRGGEKYSEDEKGYGVDGIMLLESGMAGSLSGCKGGAFSELRCLCLGLSRAAASSRCRLSLGERFAFRRTRRGDQLRYTSCGRHESSDPDQRQITSLAIKLLTKHRAWDARQLSLRQHVNYGARTSHHGAGSHEHRQRCGVAGLRRSCPFEQRGWTGDGLVKRAYGVALDYSVFTTACRADRLDPRQKAPQENGMGRCRWFSRGGGESGPERGKRVRSAWGANLSAP